MGRPKKKQEYISSLVISYLGSHYHEDLTLEQVAKTIGFSSSWLRAIFKKETGQSIWSHLLGIRVTEAMKQLLQTNLSATQIALNVGFNDFSRFFAAFKKRTGTTPIGFRKTARRNGEAPVLVDDDNLSTKGLLRFRDVFNGPGLLLCWTGESGHWHQENGILRGRSDEDLRLSFMDPLPENFSLSCDFRFMSDTNLLFTLHGGDASNFYLQTWMGKNENRISEVFLPGANHFWNEDARIIPGKWQRFMIEVVDDKIRILLDGLEIFHHQDPFPPPYSLRGRFSIGAWQTSVEIREVTIHDHGFMPLVPAVRQVDSLYVNGMYPRAMNAYMRLLQSIVDPSETMELQYKIGMCFLKQHSPIQAKTWFEKIAPWPVNPCWNNHAQIGIMEADQSLKEYSAFLKRALHLCKQEGMRDLALSCLERARNEYRNGGFFEQALECQTELCNMEGRESFLSGVFKEQRASLLFESGRHNDAVSCCREALEQRNLPASLKDRIRLTLSQILTSDGRAEESGEVLDSIRANGGNVFTLARCDLGHASNLRAQRRFEEAVDFLVKLPGRYREAPDSCVFGLLMASQICCQIHNPDRARALLQTAKDLFPGSSLFVGYYGGLFDYPPLVLEGKFPEAASCLLLAAGQGGELWTQADQILRAGILLELGEKKDEAQKTWHDASLRFPEEHCCFYGKAAEALSRDNLEFLETMPFAAFRRAELFYLTGLLCEKRGHASRAARFLELCIAEDLSLYWFTWLAREKLGRV